MTKTFVTGSKTFFTCYDDFRPKDTDTVVLTDDWLGNNIHTQLSAGPSCIFTWKPLTPEKFIEVTLKTKAPMSICKFLNPEFSKEIGFTIEHLKQLQSVRDRLDEKHLYLGVIFDAYINNNDFRLTDEQRLQAYEVYKKARKHR